jgi:hypothetical protein
VALPGENSYRYWWINLDQAEWSEADRAAPGPQVRFTTPSGEGHWIVVILSEN